MADFVRVPETDWQDILDATRGKTGGTEKMLSGEVATAIAGIETGGVGGSASEHSGEVVFDADTPVTSAGLTLNLGLPSRAKYFFMWMDREDFLALEAPTNNKLYFVLMLPVTLSSLTPVRGSNTAMLADTADRLFLAGTNVNTTGSANGYGVQGIAGTQVSHNTDVWSANEDGTITVSRPSSAGVYFYAGTYHWIAVC